MTIKSCKNLNLKKDELEILVIDNCSIDNSVEIVKELQKTMQNLKLIVNDINV
jgi:glycosyltransferase involved in cell wall biosynthesis